MTDLRNRMLDPSASDGHLLSQVCYRPVMDPYQASKEGYTYLTVTRAERDKFCNERLEAFDDKTVIQDFGAEQLHTFATGAPIMFNVRSDGKRERSNEKFRAVNGTMGTFQGIVGPSKLNKETETHALVDVPGKGVVKFPMHLKFKTPNQPLKKRTAKHARGITPPFVLAFALTIAKAQASRIRRPTQRVRVPTRATGTDASWGRGDGCAEPRAHPHCSRTRDEHPKIPALQGCPMGRRSQNAHRIPRSD